MVTSTAHGICSEMKALLVLNQVLGIPGGTRAVCNPGEETGYTKACATGIKGTP